MTFSLPPEPVPLPPEPAGEVPLDSPLTGLRRTSFRTRPPRSTPATRPAGRCWSPPAAATAPSRRLSATRRAGSTTSRPRSPTCVSSRTGATRWPSITAGARSPRRRWTGSTNGCP